MKKSYLAVISIVFLIFLGGCNASNTNNLTMDKVKELAKKGDELTWSDFEAYDGNDIGSGLIIISYQINSDYFVLIGGVGKDVKPMYIRLVKGDDMDEYIDIRYENIDSFIKS